MKEIKLTQGFVAIVDDEDYERLSHYKWHANKVGYDGDVVYARRRSRKGEKGTHIYMHRFIMNTADNQEVDHIDYNTLNNRKSNLRNVSKKDNLKNRFKKGS